MSDRPLADRVFPLAPNAMAELIGKVDIPILDPLNYFTDYSHLKILARVRSIERKLYPLLYSDENLSNATKETFRGMFHGLACKMFYLWYSIRHVGPWIIRVGDVWKEKSELADAHNLLCREIHRSGKGLFNGSFYLKVKKQKPFLPNITRTINLFVLKIISDNKLIFTTGQTAAFNEIEKSLRNQGNHFCMIKIAGAVDLKAIIKSVLNIVKYILNKSQSLTLLIIPKPYKLSNKIIESLIDKVDEPIIINTREIIKDSLVPATAYTEALIRGGKGQFKQFRNKSLIAHELRLLESAVLGELAKENNFKSILISHGSHPYFTDAATRYVHKENAQGLLISPLATVTITQSPCAQKAARLYMSELPRLKFQPIMWSHKKMSDKPIESKGIRTILHAGTTNKLNGRPWIYETSNEFVKGLKLLVRAVSELKNTHLIIRIRPNLEWNIESLKSLLPNSLNYEIKTTGSFQEDLKHADLLISYASTTIEESLYARRPVGLFGGSDRYRHLPGSSRLPNKDERNAIYHLTEYNLVSMLDAILDSHKDSLLTDNELKGYVWSKTVPDHEQFIQYLLD